MKGCVHSDDLKWELACSEKDPFKLEWFINIGGAARPGSLPSNGATTSGYAAVDSWIEAKSYRPMIVHGGLVIPWYFIALALMGAAVSLARRIPEYQRRALEPKDEDFTAPRAREYMEFQILQLLSAPLIAVAAYNLVTPGTLQASTAIGFITGFSSETILVAIGALADRLIGKSTKAEAKKEEPKKEEPKKEETEIGEPKKLVVHEKLAIGWPRRTAAQSGDVQGLRSLLLERSFNARSRIGESKRKSRDYALQI